MKNTYIIIESSFTYVVLLYQQKNSFIKKNSKEWSLKCYSMVIFNFFLFKWFWNFQKEINVIMYIIDFKKKSKLESFQLNKISIKYEISKFMFL